MRKYTGMKIRGRRETIKITSSPNPIIISSATIKLIINEIIGPKIKPKFKLYSVTLRISMVEKQEATQLFGQLMFELN